MASNLKPKSGSHRKSSYNTKCVMFPQDSSAKYPTMGCPQSWLDQHPQSRYIPSSSQHHQSRYIPSSSQHPQSGYIQSSSQHRQSSHFPQSKHLRFPSKHPQSSQYPQSPHLNENRKSQRRYKRRPSPPPSPPTPPPPQAPGASATPPPTRPYLCDKESSPNLPPIPLEDLNVCYLINVYFRPFLFPKYVHV